MEPRDSPESPATRDPEDLKETKEIKVPRERRDLQESRETPDPKEKREKRVSFFFEHKIDVTVIAISLAGCRKLPY